MRINNNIMAMNTHRQYGINNTNVAKSVEKLSSGFRINRAGDDAAGLAISEKMRAQIRGLTMASKNSQDAISLVQTAEGALQETHNILQRMRELAVQSASDTNETTIDRDALNKEFQALIAEIDDTSDKTKFNDMGLIDGSFSAYKAVVTNATTGSTGTITGGTAIVHGQALTIGATAIGNQTFDLNFTAVAGTAQAPSSVPITISAPSGPHGITGVTLSFSNDIGAKFNGAVIDTFSMTATGSSDTMSIDIDGVTFEITGQDFSGATLGSVTLTNSDGEEVTLTFAGTFDSSEAATLATDINGLLGTVPTDGVSNQVMVTDEDGNEYMLQAGQTRLQLANGVAFEFEAIEADFSNIDDIFGTTDNEGTGITVTVELEKGVEFVVQTGANKGDELQINIDKMDSKTLGVWAANVASRLDASDAIEHTNDAINKVSTQRAALGALQNRLEHKIANLDTSAENLQAAEARIRDLDMAKEMTTFTKNNILSQAATAMLAQANSLPQGVLQLLR